MKSRQYQKKDLWLSSDSGGRRTYYPFYVQREKALLLQMVGKWNEAEAIFRSGVKFVEAIGTPWLEAKWRSLLSAILILKGSYDEAFKLAEQSSDTFRGLGDQKELAVSHSYLGNIFYKQCDYAKAMEYFREYLAISEKVGNQQDTGHALGLIGVIYYDQGNYDEAMKYYDRQIEIFERLNDIQRLSWVLGNIGNVYLDKEDYVRAMEYYQRSLKCSQIAGNKSSICNSIGNMAIIHAKNGQYQQALEGYNQQLALAREMGDQRIEAYAMVNMGDLHYSRGQLDQARDCYQRQLEISVRFGDKPITSFGHYMLGKLERLSGDLKSSERCLDRAVALGREINLMHYLCSYLYQQALNYWDTGRPELAAATVGEALEIAGRVSNREITVKGGILKIQLECRDAPGSLAQKLLELSSEHAEPRFQAEIEYALFRADRSGERREKALSLYRSLYAATPEYEYRIKIDELQTA
jgi:tetratricopeptide (TPR) repeat protein